MTNTTKPNALGSTRSDRAARARVALEESIPASWRAAREPLMYVT